HPPHPPAGHDRAAADRRQRGHGLGIPQPARGAGAARRADRTALFERAGCLDFGNLDVTNRTHILLWTDSSAAYLEAIKAAGLADRVVADTLPRKEKPSAEQMARTEALMAYVVPPGVLPAMPKLRWAQAMTAGVEGWIALPDLPANLVLSCARGTHRESMPENIIGALFYVAKPYAAAVENQKRGKWVQSVAQPLTGKTLGILGLG